MIYGSDGGYRVKVYKDQSSSFIRWHQIKSNKEYIHILQHDGTISDGIYRERFANGETAIGSQYFLRSGREEDRVYQLYRYKDNGDIYYYDQFAGEDDTGLRTLAAYRFNQETLEWREC